MSAKKPVVVNTSNGELQNMQSGDFVDIPQGGTGSTTAPGARTALGLAIGTNVQAWTAQGDALAAQTTPGFFTLTALNTVIARQMAVASTARLTVTNSDGVAGDPTFDLASLTNTGAGSFLKVSVDSYGRTVGTAPVTTSDLTALLSTTYAALGGATFTGSVTLAADPTQPLHAATKQYVDAVANGFIGQLAVKLVAVANVTVSNPGTSTFDATAASINDRIFLTAQTNGYENGPWVFNGPSVAMTRPNDYNNSAQLQQGDTFCVTSGTDGKYSIWTLISAGPYTLGTTNLTFTQTNGLADITVAYPLSRSGNTISANLSARIVNTSNAFDLAAGIITPGTYLGKVTFDTYGRAVSGAALVPSDIGAQPVSNELTAVSGVATTGILVRTAAATWSTLSLAVASTNRLTVTNASGVAGTPTFDLAVSGVAAGTYNGITLDQYGRATQAVAVINNSSISQLTNNTGATTPICSAVYSSLADKYALAKADVSGTSNVCGILNAGVNASALGNVVTSGEISATTAQWDAVTGQSGGLTANATYFLSNATAGAITTTVPSTGYLQAVGLALSTTKMLVNIGPRIQL